MSKIYYRTLIVAFMVLLFQGIGGAVSSEYKNTLDRVELVKTGEENYIVNLYMQKNYLSPVKIIKKSDLNYYILLPETKNSSSSINYRTPDIQSVSANAYPYAGVDVNNGYTKININTTKPIEFNLKIRSSSFPKAEATTPYIAQRIIQKRVEEPVRVAEGNKVQKKNTDTKKEEVKKSVKEPTTQTTQTAIVSQPKTEKQVNKPTKTTTVPKQKTEYTNTNTIASKSHASNNIKREVSKTPAKNSVQESIKEQKTKVKEVLIPENKEEFLQYPKKDANDAKLSTKESFYAAAEKNANENIEEKEVNEVNEDKPEELIEEEPIAENNFLAAAKIPLSSGIKDKLKSGIKFVEAKLGTYGLGLFDVTLIFFTGLSGFLVMLFLMSNRQNTQKMKSKEDLIELGEKPSLVPKKKANDENVTKKNKEEGKYFIFDKNVKQTGFTDPAISAIKKGYELTAYDPEINIQHEKFSSPSTADNETEYEIIQKILKEDTFVEIGQKQAETITKEKIEHNVPQQQSESEEAIQKSNAVTSPIAQPEIGTVVSKAKQQVELQDGLIMYSKAEIAPERGFMCVSYDNNISLVGFIFDDIFVLHNFKKAQLDNYDIQYRMSERDGKGALYIVKVGSEKMIINVGNKTMKLELTL